MISEEELTSGLLNILPCLLATQYILDFAEFEGLPVVVLLVQDHLVWTCSAFEAVLSRV